MATCLPFIYDATRFVVSVIFFAVPFSNGSTEGDYHKCSSLCSCGPVKGVGYRSGKTMLGQHFVVFMRSGSSPLRVVIIPALGGSGHYNVRHNDMTSNAIEVARDKNETCQILQDRTSIDVTAVSPLKLEACVRNLTLFYRCPHALLVRSLNFTHYPFYVFDRSISVHYFNRTTHGRSYQVNVTVPVHKRELDMVNHEMQILRVPWRRSLRYSTHWT